MPVLVIHRQGDSAVPASDGRYLAEHIPGAEYAELPGEDHTLFAGDQRAVHGTVVGFLDRAVAGGAMRAALRRADRKNAAGTGWDALTPSEREVAALIAAGMTTSQVAARLRISGDTDPALPAGFAGELAELVSAGRRGDAVELYQTQAVGIPQEMVAQMRHAPFRPSLEAIAHTLADDAAIIGDRSLPGGLLATLTVPALVITGEQSPPFLGNAAHAAAQTLPHGRRAVLPGQGHDINPGATALVMAEFLAS